MRLNAGMLQLLAALARTCRCLLLLALPARAYPYLFVQDFAGNNCSAVPEQVGGGGSRA